MEGNQQAAGPRVGGVVDEPAVAVLTARGMGAIATLAVRGPEAVKLVERFFRAAAGKPLASVRHGRILWGWWGSGEEVVVCVEDRSYVEVHAHGGKVSVERILSDLGSAGCRVVSWADWVDWQERDPLKRQAWRQLSHAPTARAAGILLDQCHGALHREVTQIIAALERNEPDMARQRLRQLLDRAPLGLHLAVPWQVVLAGAPNVGKSSLLNAMAGFARSIVYDQPGTTRDVVQVQTAIQGWPVCLSDTAGLRESEDALEMEGTRRARAAIQQADLVIWVHDLSQGSPKVDPGALPVPPQRTILACNKCDLVSEPVPLPPGAIATSALTGQGIDRLMERIVGQLVPEPPAPGTAVPFTDQQVGALQQAFTAVEQGEAGVAARILQALMGR